MVTRFSKAQASWLLFAASTAALLPLAGCHVDADKHNGNDKVEISTPFGGMSVKTNQDAASASTGMTVYPGATLMKKDHGDDGAADVNMNFGGFHLGVKALSYRTDDSPSKVLAFYNKDMTKFGTVLHCKDNKPVSGPEVTEDGLTCSDDKHRHGQIHIDTDSDSDSGEEQLKAGSMRHQHIVAVNQKDGYTKISLISLDLPGSFNFNDGSGSSQ